MDGTTLRFEDEALEKIVEQTQEKAMGARGLRAVLETTMFDIMYKLPAEEDIKECVITRGFIESREPPELIYRKKRA
jgi:ATP-dependent Clp protease ATP-binding subunit ClpX